MAHRFRGRPGGLRSLAAAGSRHQPSSWRRWSRNPNVDVGFSSLFTGQTQGSLWLRVRKDAEEIVENGIDGVESNAVSKTGIPRKRSNRALSVTL